jgi:hypothetical protein
MICRRAGSPRSLSETAWGVRSWLYGAVGFGYPGSFWRDFVTARRRAAYDDIIVIELEPFRYGSNSYH